MNMRALCFVDDDADEVRRFREQLEGAFLIGAGTSLPDAVERLREQGRTAPDLFVLDLYFPEGPPNTAEELRELAEAWERLLEAKAAFLGVLGRLRQSSRGGLALAKSVRAAFPGARFSFFTRKGTLEDAIDGLDAGAASIIKKPDPTREERVGASVSEAYDLAFRRNLPTILRGIERGLGGMRGGGE
jgi:CheY-like chemotaxis protein